MSHRVHLFSLRIAHALRESLKEEPYRASAFTKDLLAGLTVGIIAIPLAMALAIASGVPPQYGLYTAMIAGLIIPLTGGSRFSVSGPTAAFVVILFPIVQKYGFSGLLLATMLGGAIMVGMAIMRLGRYIEYIPESVTLGFTSGIATVIAVLQIKDFFGLTVGALPEHFFEKLSLLISELPSLSFASLFVGAITLAILVYWPRIKLPFPGHLPAVVMGALVSFVLNKLGFEVATIGSSFQYELPNGQIGNGIPPILPFFDWPWNRVLEGEIGLRWSWPLAQDLLSAAFAIAMLGAIESLLCAVILDGATGKKHSANSELLGQGLGNIIAPLFGGITATAAIARSAANLRAGAKTPIAAMVHALVVLFALLYLAPLLSYLPMASMAALLLMVAWNMSEVGKAKHLLQTAPKSDMTVFLVCFSLTVLFDMVIAITAGIVLASLLFMKDIAEMTKVHDISNYKKLVDIALPEGWKVLKINGPLFFAAADRIFGELSLECTQQKGVILYLDGVSVLDAGGVAAMTKFLDKLKKADTKVYLCDFQHQPLKTLVKAKFIPDQENCFTYSTLSEALEAISKNYPQEYSDRDD